MKNTYYSFLTNTCLFHSTGLNLVITSHTIGSVAWHCWWTAFRRFSTFTFYSRSDQDIFPFFLKNCATNKHMQFFFLEYKKITDKSGSFDPWFSYNNIQRHLLQHHKSQHWYKFFWSKVTMYIKVDDFQYTFGFSKSI